MKLSNSELRALWLACYLAEGRMLKGSLKSIDDATVESYTARGLEFRALVERLEAELLKRDGDEPPRDFQGPRAA